MGSIHKVELSFPEASAVTGAQKQLDPYWVVLTVLRQTRKNKIYAGVLSDKELLPLVLKKCEYPEQEFLHETGRKIGRLIKDQQFCEECQELGLDPFPVATHVVFAGKTKLNLVKDKRLDVVFDNGKLASMKAPIFSREELGLQKVTNNVRIMENMEKLSPKSITPSETVFIQKDRVKEEVGT